MSTFVGRLFGPDLPGAGITAVASWTTDGALVIMHSGIEITATQLRIVAGGFNNASLRISWQGAAGEHALVIEDKAAREACLASAPQAQAQPLTAARGAHLRVERRFRLGWAFLGLLLLLPFFAVGAFYLGQEQLTDLIVKRIPGPQEEQLGNLVLAQTRLQTPLQEDGPAVAALRSIGDKLTVHSSYHYRWFVAEAPEINAFAAPGGVVVVNAGLLRAVATPEELAGVLAHEIAHVELRHSLKVLVKSLSLRALLTIALGDYSGTAVAQGAQQLSELGFSREAEREADREGLRRLVAAQIDPHGMLRFFSTLTQESTMTAPTLLSTHPAPEERLVELRRQIAASQGNWRPLDIELNTLRKGLESTTSH